LSWVGSYWKVWVVGGKDKELKEEVINTLKELREALLKSKAKRKTTTPDPRST